MLHALLIPLSFFPYFKCTNNCHMVCSFMECNLIKVMSRACVADSWVLVKSNKVARVEARSSLVGLGGSGWGHVQQAAPLEVDIKWVSKSLSWL